MSIEATTYEELKINNVNEKTVQLTSEVGRYLAEDWGVNFIELTVDGCVYSECDIDEIKNNPELYDVCINLAKYTDINLKLSSCNGASAYYRIESSFMKYLTNDEELKGNVVYRSIDYYDVDFCIDTYVYDKNGLRSAELVKSADIVSDIKSWYCYNFEVRINTENTENEELHQKVLDLFGKIEECINAYIENPITDDFFDYGEMIFFTTASLSLDQIHKLINILQNMQEMLNAFDDVDVNVEISGVADGADDYRFAAAIITNPEGEISAEFARF